MKYPRLCAPSGPVSGFSLTFHVDRRNPKLYRVKTLIAYTSYKTSLTKSQLLQIPVCENNLTSSNCVQFFFDQKPGTNKQTAAVLFHPERFESSFFFPQRSLTFNVKTAPPADCSGVCIFSGVVSVDTGRASSEAK